MSQSYSMSNSFVYPPSNYAKLHSCAMTPNELVAKLIEQSGKSLNKVAAEISPHANFQGTLYKFVHGEVKSPSWNTAKRIAAHFDFPPAAMHDAQLAHQIAVERGLVKQEAAPRLVAAQPPGVYTPAPERSPPARFSSTVERRIAKLNRSQLAGLELVIVAHLDAVVPVQAAGNSSAR
jgi:hypothetical protein